MRLYIGKILPQTSLVWEGGLPNGMVIYTPVAKCTIEASRLPNEVQIYTTVVKLSVYVLFNR